MLISGRHSDGKTRGELKNSKVGYFLTGLMGTRPGPAGSGIVCDVAVVTHS